MHDHQTKEHKSNSKWSLQFRMIQSVAIDHSYTPHPLAHFIARLICYVEKRNKKRTGYFFTFKFRDLFLKTFAAHSLTNTFDKLRPYEMAEKINKILMPKIWLLVFVASIFVPCNLTFRWKLERRTHTTEKQKTLKRQSGYFHFLLSIVPITVPLKTH